MNVYRKDNTVIRAFEHETLQIIPCGKNGIRIRATMNPDFVEVPQAILSDLKALEDVRIHETSEGFFIENGRIVCQLTPQGTLIFSNRRNELLKELTVYPIFSSARHYEFRGGDKWRITVDFTSYPEECIYGLGQHRNGRLNQKGCVIDIEQRNSEIFIPFMYSNKGYAFLWNHAGTGRVELGYNRTRWVADSSSQIDYWIGAVDTAEEALIRYFELTGFPPNFPDWATGFWQCKLRYQTQEELLNIAREYKRRGLPLSVIVIDFFHWTRQGEWMFDSNEWPDPAEMVKELKSMGIELMVSIWPTVSPHSQNYCEMKRRGFLVKTVNGVEFQMPFWDKNPEGHVCVAYYDPFNPEAREYIWNKVKEGYLKYGVKVYWLDACEPEINPRHHHNVKYFAGTGEEIGCMYPLMHQRGFYEGLRKEGIEDIIMLCRSAWAGSQAVGAAVWSGDIPSTFESLEEQIKAGLNMAMSGIPWWTTDIGGFAGGDPQDEYFQELIIRWFQYGVFCPIFRLHGNRKPLAGKKYGDNEIWSFGPRAYEIIKKLLFLREELKQYIVNNLNNIGKTGKPLMRPLFFDYYEDQIVWQIEDEFLFGFDILVAPVTKRGVIEREVYLPAGREWIDITSNRVIEGGRTVKVKVDLEVIPVFVAGNADCIIIDILSRYLRRENV